MEGKIIFIEGIPGSSKTTFCKSYQAFYKNVVILEEWVDNDFLATYLNDMHNMALEFQTRAQEETLKKLQQAHQLAKKGKTVLIDRGIIGNICFAEVQYENGYIKQQAMNIYRAKYDWLKICGDIKCEVWYLQCEPQIALTRIRNRDRNGENTYTIEYLAKLKAKHDKLLIDAKYIDANKKLKVSHEGLVDIKQILIEVK